MLSKQQQQQQQQQQPKKQGNTDFVQISHKNAYIYAILYLAGR